MKGEKREGKKSNARSKIIALERDSCSMYSGGDYNAENVMNFILKS